VENLQDSFLVHGLRFLRPRYLGDDIMLITGDEELDIGKIIEEHKD